MADLNVELLRSSEELLGVLADFVLTNANFPELEGIGKVVIAANALANVVRKAGGKVRRAA